MFPERVRFQALSSAQEAKPGALLRSLLYIALDTVSQGFFGVKALRHIDGIYLAAVVIHFSPNQYGNAELYSFSASPGMFWE